jgi:hypothetical protein
MPSAIPHESTEFPGVDECHQQHSQRIAAELKTGGVCLLFQRRHRDFAQALTRLSNSEPYSSMLGSTSDAEKGGDWGLTRRSSSQPRWIWACKASLSACSIASERCIRSALPELIYRSTPGRIVRKSATCHSASNTRTMVSEPARRLMLSVVGRSLSA